MANEIIPSEKHIGRTRSGGTVKKFTSEEIKSFCAKNNLKSVYDNVTENLKDREA